MRGRFKMPIFILFIALSITSLGGIVDDYEKEISRLEKQCEEKMSKDYSTTGMVLATQEYYEELDKVLNKVYKELMITLDDKGKMTLRDSQREWIKFRDKEVAFAANLYSKKDGSIWKLSTPNIMTNLMENRIRELASYIGDQRDELF